MYDVSTRVRACNRTVPCESTRASPGAVPHRKVAERVAGGGGLQVRPWEPLLLQTHVRERDGAAGPTMECTVAYSLGYCTYSMETAGLPSSAEGSRGDDRCSACDPTRPDSSGACVCVCVCACVCVRARMCVCVCVCVCV